MTKAAISKYTEIVAKENPKLTVSSVTPGFIQTDMTTGMGASRTAEDGTVPVFHCLFN